MPATDKESDSDKDLSPAHTVSEPVMAEQITQDVVKEAQSMGGSLPIGDSATTINHSAADDGETSPIRTTADPKPFHDSTVPLSNTQNSETDSAVVTHQANDEEVDSAGAQDVTLSADKALSGGSSELLANGVGGDNSEAEDGASQQVLVDAGGGSDTDTSKGDSANQLQDAPSRHLRTSSVKKPTAFKSVSVTKNFLAKAAPSPAFRAGDKGPASGQANASSQQSAKPRLVAKSGSGLGNSVPRLSKVNGNTGPDASKVWNKNKPAPPPPPKQFTDEELKQQYGIHMATRLQADEAGKESKWADIDDDEDDWAPETVEWMDGTKTSVLPADNQPPPPEAPKPVLLKADKPAELVKPVLTNLQKPSLTSTNKTILKPGVHLFKGAPEKPTLVVKPSAPTPVKSPWAPLPPVDRVSPVVISTPVQQAPQSRFSQRDPHGFDALPPAPSPAKEIAADDFNRSWREERGNKELFNSQSGRYEPVPEPRRGSFRQDGGLRQPSVLQRPSHPGQQTPAEPSPAFQTTRSSGVGDGNMWSRGRALSSVSGGDTARGRTMSSSKPQDIAFQHELRSQPRRETQSPPSVDVVPIATGTDTRPGLPSQRASYTGQGVSPGKSRQVSWTRPSPMANHAQPSSPSAAQQVSQSTAPVGEPQTVDSQPPVQPVPDPAALQQQVMRDKIERARQAKSRRIEEEKKEAAAKAERLRLKIASLEPRSSEVKEMKQLDLPAPPASEQVNPQEESVSVSSPPKPPVPTAEGEISQYGVMKIHQPQLVKKPVVAESSSADLPKTVALSDNVPENVPARTDVSSTNVSPRKMHTDMASSRVDEATLQVQPTDSSRSTNQLSSHLQDREAQAWNSPASSSTYSGWGNHNIATNMTTHTTPANVWEYPNRSKALGNGTFDNSYMVASVHSQSHAPAPGPIAPPNSTSKVSPQAVQTISDHLQRLSHQAHLQPEQADLRLSPVLGQQVPDSFSVGGPSSGAAGGPGPIAPPRGPSERLLQQGTQFTQMDWHSFAKQHPKPEIETPMQNDTRVAHQSIYRETFKQTAMEDNLGKRRVLRTENTVHDPHATQGVNKGLGAGLTLAQPSQPSAMPVLDQDIISMVPHHAQAGSGELSNHLSQTEDVTSNRVPGAPALAAGYLQPSHGLTPPRSSRFFPPRSSSSPTSSKSDSPPPPDSEDHPVHAGDPHHPRVSLPIPKAVVKLPPTTFPPSQPAATPMIPPRIGSRPIVSQMAWQTRFNDLLGKAAPMSQPTSSPPQTRVPETQVLPVSSASKAPLDVSSHRDPATVSLPSSSERPATRKAFSFAVDHSSDIVSKTTAEEDLMDDRQFGSLPIVCLPRGAHINAHIHPLMMHTTRPQSKFQRPVEVLSIDPFFTTLADCEQKAAGYIINIRLPQWNTAKTQLMRRQPRPRNSSGYKKRRDNPPRDGNGHLSSPPSRKPSSNFQPQPQSQQQAPPAQILSPRPPRPNGNWNSSRTTPQSDPWNKRSTSGMVH